MFKIFSRLSLVEQAINSVFDYLVQLKKEVRATMAAIDELNAAVATLEQVVTTVITDNKKLHDDLAAAIAANDQPALQAIVARINVQNANLQSIVQS